LPETSRGDGGSLFECALKDLPSLGLLVKLMLDNVKGVLRFGGKRGRVGREDSVGGTEGPNAQRLAPQTPESGAQRESEQSTKELLAAYQGMLDVVEELPAIVWLRWGEKGLWRFLKVPYLRWFLGYFLTHHIRKSLSTLSRRFHAIDALAGDPDSNKANREVVDLYLKSLPPMPYRNLAFAVVIAALLVALPLQSFGNVFQVLDIVGALIRFDTSQLARAFQYKELWSTVRATIVFLFGFAVVAALLTSPFALKRMLFNLYPATKERIDSTAARGHTYSVEGLYALEDRVFGEVGLQRPKEGRGDLVVQICILMLLLLLGLFVGFLALVIAMSWDFTIEVTSDAPDLPANVNVTLPEVHWIFYALPALISLVAFVVLLRRLIVAWGRRNRPASE
jgi:hypothetical protein